MTRMVATLAAACGGALLAWLLAASQMARPPEWSLRTNVSGAQVPAVLGLPVALAGAAASEAVRFAGGLGWDVPRTGRAGVAATVVLVVMGLAGLWDDRRGNESARGFAGHLSAAGGGRLTGGLVKIAAGGLAGVAAGAAVYGGDLVPAALTALAVPLAANLFNLLDRAPGRTGKTALVAGVPLLALGHAGWAVAAAGTFGALALVLPTDLRERAMLGDAGANPVGALVGLGLAVSLGVPALAAAVVVLLALNAASERWSFSEVIARTPWLRAFDSIGRK